MGGLGKVGGSVLRVASVPASSAALDPFPAVSHLSEAEGRQQDPHRRQRKGRRRHDAVLPRLQLAVEVDIVRNPNCVAASFRYKHSPVAQPN